MTGLVRSLPGLLRRSLPGLVRSRPGLVRPPRGEASRAGERGPADSGSLRRGSSRSTCSPPHLSRRTGSFHRRCPSTSEVRGGACARAPGPPAASRVPWPLRRGRTPSAPRSRRGITPPPVRTITITITAPTPTYSAPALAAALAQATAQTCGHATGSELRPAGRRRCPPGEQGADGEGAAGGPGARAQTPLGRSSPRPRVGETNLSIGTDGRRARAPGGPASQGPTAVGPRSPAQAASPRVPRTRGSEPCAAGAPR